jgi:hypothetical protein
MFEQAKFEVGFTVLCLSHDLAGQDDPDGQDAPAVDCLDCCLPGGRFVSLDIPAPFANFVA